MTYLFWTNMTVLHSKNDCFPSNSYINGHFCSKAPKWPLFKIKYYRVLKLKMTKMVVNFSMSKMTVAQILEITIIFGKRSFWPQINGHFGQRFFYICSTFYVVCMKIKKNRSTLWTLTVGCRGSMILYTWTWLTLTLFWPRAFGQSFLNDFKSQVKPAHVDGDLA